MIIIDMTQFRPGRTEREARSAVRRIVLPFAQPAEDEPHEHPYTIALIQDDECGMELATFEAPCPNGNAAGHVRALVANLRELADEVEAAHADILTEADEEPVNDVPAHVLLDLLGLVQCKVTEAEVMSWTPEQRQQAEHWASAAHLNASDNDHIQVPDQPSFVAQGDFMVGDVVRRRQDGELITVTGGGVWLDSWYELVAGRDPITGALPTHGVCPTHGRWVRTDGPDACHMCHTNPTDEG